MLGCPRGEGGANTGPTSLPCPQSLLRQHCLCSLSKSDTRLHELHRGPKSCRGEPSRERRTGLRGGGACTLRLLPGYPNSSPSQVTSVLTPTLAPRPASVDILHPRWLEVPRGTSRPLTAFSHRELPRATPAATLPSICPEATYSNVGLAARPVVWAGARLTSSHARPGPEAGPGVAEYACIQKLEGTDQGPQSLRQWKAEVTPAVQVK